MKRKSFFLKNISFIHFLPFSTRLHEIYETHDEHNEKYGILFRKIITHDAENWIFMRVFTQTVVCNGIYAP